ncbi:FAD-dependent oxidoreductase [Ktedonosporobacter rubrisoli]|uniref:FAD-dependent oxidoreductase n=1 Tax=Ktedonosporobacter rubrisoli TaxID=2509675 RepID=A0A4P6K3Z5_KTERU|nr:FAD-dependent oxidoreductase [Ktedonosporobacter rubrisoli]QBD82530.1 FAD-dependent oxidoreductase [Ktedonosporobacter rubrisoli]
MKTEVAIVGAGPAGLAAAAAAGEAGCHVTLIDSYARPGGQYYKQIPQELRARRAHALHVDFAKAAELMALIEANPHIQVLSGATVWTAQRAPSSAVTLSLDTAEGYRELQTDYVILALGAYDRVLPFPGWDLPGVMTAGAAQTLTKSQRILPGKRVVLSGSGPFLLPVAVGLAEGGAQVVGVFEATTPLQWSRYAWQVWRHWDKLREGASYLRRLRAQRVPLSFGRAVIAAHGDERVQQVTVARVHADWSPVAGSEEVLDVDAVCVGYGFLPSLELPTLLGCATRYDPLQATFVVEHDASMQSSQPGIYVAGEITGIGGSAVALAQGALAGLAVAEQAGRLSKDEIREKLTCYRRTVDHSQHFAAVLNQLFALRPGWMRWLRPETLVCRCEEVTYQQIETAVKSNNAGDIKTVKSLTRCGMGLCQGRVCGHTVAALTAAWTGRNPETLGSLNNRPIAKPIQLGAACEAETLRLS